MPRPSPYIETRTVNGKTVTSVQIGRENYTCTNHSGGLKLTFTDKEMVCSGFEVKE